MTAITIPLIGQPFDAQAFNFYLISMLQSRFGLEAPLSDPVLHLLEHPGKGLRPSLAYAVAQACNGNQATGVFAVAAAGELLHLASLIHDDLVDGASVRRGIVALHQAFDPTTAVLTGDYMLGSACALLSHDGAEGTLRRMGPAVQALAEAELLEVRARGQLNNLELARRIAIGKTGALFGWIAASTAIECGEWSGDAAWHTWGIQLGILFQVADDMGDQLAIDEGKDVGLDAKMQTPTIMSALLRLDPSGQTLANEVNQLIDVTRKSPAHGQQLTSYIETIVERAQLRLASLLHMLNKK